MSELATQSDMHPNQFKQSKMSLDGVTEIFDNKPRASKALSLDLMSLLARIGQLTREDDFCGALKRVGLPPPHPLDPFFAFQAMRENGQTKQVVLPISSTRTHSGRATGHQHVACVP